MNTPEIPPPPRLPSLPPPIRVRAKTWRASVPQAVIIALITTLGTTVSNACGTNPRLEAVEIKLDRIDARLAALEAATAGELSRVEVQPIEDLGNSAPVYSVDIFHSRSIDSSEDDGRLVGTEF